MKLNEIKTLIMIGLAVILFLVLWPLIKWIAVCLLAITVVFAVYIYFESRRTEREIRNDPEGYYDRTFASMMDSVREKEKISADVIDAEYKEKEIESE